MKYYVIPVTGDITMHEVEELTLKDLQTLVGGWIEYVYMNASQDGDICPVFVVNEEGLPRGLHRNDRATLIADDERPPTYLHGTAVLLGVNVHEDYEDASVPESFVKKYAGILKA